VPQGVVCNKLASSIDLLPTLASIAGGNLSENKIDGVNIIDLWKGKTDVDPRQDLFYYYGTNNLNAVRKGNWKLVFPHTFQSYEATVPGNDGYGGRRINVKVDSLELYNLMRDPGERYNVIDMYPDILEELLAVGDEARSELGDLNVGIEKGTGNRTIGLLRE
jgi:arylsulfatase